MRLVAVWMGIALLVGACSSGSTGGGGDGGTSGSSSSGTTSGTSGVPLANPQVVVATSLAPGANPSEACPESGAFVTIGSFGEPPTKPAAPVPNGGTFGGGAVSVACRVANTGSAYAVEGSAELTGAGGGSLVVSGTFDSGDGPKAVSLTVAREGRSYAQKDCAARFAPPLHGIAGGRVWMEIECPTAEAPALLRRCRVSAEVRFENCRQQ